MTTRRTSAALTRVPFGAVAVVALLAFGPAGAQTPRGSSNNAAMQQLQALAAERTRLQQENESLKKQLEAAKAAPKTSPQEASLRSEAAAARAAAAKADAAAATANQTQQQTRAKLDELVAKFRETVETMRTIEGERNQLSARLTQRDREFDTCAVRNAELYTITKDVLDRYENAGFGHAVARSEPFTGIARARIENLVDEYRSRADALRVAPAAQDSKDGRPAPRDATAR